MTATAKPRAAEAGHWGKDIRSDLHVAIEPRDRGGIEIDLESRVAPYYGDAIRAQTAAGPETARRRARPRRTFTTKARCPSSSPRASKLPSACRDWRRPASALPDTVAPPARHPHKIACAARVSIFPGTEPKYFINAALHGPDAIILDLEDSVHHAEKDAARILVRNALRAVDFGPCERMVRINQLPLGLEDLEEIIPESPDLILIPKVETSRASHASRPHDQRAQRCAIRSTAPSG